MSIHFTSVSPHVAEKLENDAVLITPVPHEVPAPDLAAPAPSAVYHYCTAEGALMAYVARYDMGDDKRFVPYTLWSTPDGKVNWYRKGLGDNRPLYRLPALAAAPEKPVLLVEGEKCADAVAGFDGWVGTTWMGGANAPGKTDFSPLAGRKVLILPDLDAPGAGAAQKLIEILRDVGAAEVTLFDTARLAQEMGAEDPEGYDIADAVKAGLTEARFADLIARDGWVTTCFPAPETAPANPILREIAKQYGITPAVPEGFELSPDGVYLLQPDRYGRDQAVFAGSPLVVLGRTRALQGSVSWGHLIAVKTPVGTWDTLVLPARLLAGEGREMRETLAEHGHIGPQSRAGRQGLAEYIAYATTDQIVDVATRPGWHGDSFALRERIISPPDHTGRIIADMGQRAQYLQSAGDRAAWQNMAKLAEHNSRLAFAIAAALSAPLLRVLGRKGGGVHFCGHSSRGKTILLTAAGSVWGGGGTDGFVRSWRMSDNGCEGIAAEHNDLPMMLDEMGLAKPELLDEMIYMIANGHSKQRAARDGSALPTVQWQSLVLSTGEHTVETHLRSAAKMRHMPGGLAVRMPDVPIFIGPDRTLEDLCGRSSEEKLLEEIHSLAKTNFGFAGPDFLQLLVSDLAAHKTLAEKLFSEFHGRFCAPDDDAQVRRAAQRFALAAVAGELAASWGILPWVSGASETAARICFEAWKDLRGGSGSQEENSARQWLKAFFDSEGSARFEKMRPSDEGDEDPQLLRTTDHVVRDRCGYSYDDEDYGTVYCIPPAIWESVICRDCNAALMLKIVQDCGALVPGEGGRTQKKMRLPSHPKGTRVYVIRAALLP